MTSNLATGGADDLEERDVYQPNPSTWVTLTGKSQKPCHQGQLYRPRSESRSVRRHHPDRVRTPAARRVRLCHIHSPAWALATVAQPLALNLHDELVEGFVLIHAPKLSIGEKGRNMDKKTSVTNESLESVAHRHLSKWLISDDLQDYMRHAWEQSCWPERVQPFVTISREAGAGGGEIARNLGEALGWDVLDSEILDFMAERYQLPRDMLEVVDETKANWIQDIFGEWFDSQVVSHEKFLVYLERILWLAAMHGRVVIVGRGAQFVLPRDKGLRVRVVAPKPFRVRRVMENRELTEVAAERWTAEVDEGRHQWARRYFDRALDDPHLYDLVLNIHRVGLQAAPQIIANTCHRMWPEEDHPNSRNVS